MKIKAQDLLIKLQKIPLFADLDLSFLFDFIASVDFLNFKKDEIICNEGEYEDSCCVILSGSVGVWVKNHRGVQEQVAFLGYGEIFGEIAALSGNSRIATIKSNELTEILCMDKKLLFSLMDYSKNMRVITNQRYRERLLRTELKKIKIFEDFPNMFFDELVQNVEFLTYKIDETVLSYDKEADGFFLIIFGFAKVLIPCLSKTENKTKTTGESQAGPIEKGPNFKIAAYLAPGQFFGEVGLIEKRKRTANVSALTRLEVIKIDQALFQSILNKYSGIKNMLEKVIANRKRSNIKVEENEEYEKLMDWIVTSKIIQTDTVLLIDLSKCVKCGTCINSCERIFGTSRLALDGLKFNNILIPASCRHCRQPLCLEDCPTGAILRDFSGEVYHKDFCVGCGQCAKKCPYNNIAIVDRVEKKYKLPFKFSNKLTLRAGPRNKQRGVPLEVLDRRQGNIRKDYEGFNRRLRVASYSMGKQRKKYPPLSKSSRKVASY